MSVLVVGSVAFDTVESPFGKVERVLGGSASYFSFAASLFAPVRLVGIIGTDFPQKWLELFHTRQIDLEGMKTAHGKTFSWAGRYSRAMDDRQTIAVELNVFADFAPELPPGYRDSQYVFLANGSPKLQKQVLNQLTCPRLVACDTMDHWIRDELQDLLEVLQQVDGAVINQEEAAMLTGKVDAVDAAQAVLKLGPDFVIIKQGSQGSLLAWGDRSFTLPAYTAGKVIDPTGAGDSFAGALMGYLTTIQKIDFETLKQAMALGTAAASFAIEDFSLEGLRRASRADIQERSAMLKGQTPSSPASRNR